MPRAKAVPPAPAPPVWRNRIVRQDVCDPTTLSPSPHNWRTHPPLQKDALQGALAELGWIQQLVVNTTTGHVVDGHLRLALALEYGEPQVPVLYVELTEDEERLALLTLDPLSAMAEANREQLDALLRTVSTGDAALQQVLAQLAEAHGLFPEPGGAPPGAGQDGQGAGSLQAHFLVPPFSVLDARQGYWQERKRAWLALGIQSELGRGENIGAIPPNEAALRERRFAGQDGPTPRGDGHGRPLPA